LRLKASPIPRSAIQAASFSVHKATTTLELDAVIDRLLIHLLEEELCDSSQGCPCICPVCIMPVSGKLVLKGGQTLVSKDIKKKSKSKKKKRDPAAEVTARETTGSQPTSTEPGPEKEQGRIGEAYEKEFKFETERADSAKPRSTAWGVSYRKPPSILHGYSAPVTGDTREERLDLRCAKKADRMCK
jgi:hypothetical protein